MAMDPTQATPLSVGVTVMPEWFQSEGIDAVLDRLQALGANAVRGHWLKAAPVSRSASNAKVRRFGFRFSRLSSGIAGLLVTCILAWQ